MPDLRSGLLSPTKVANHLACAHRTQLDRQVANGELQFDFQPDPRLLALIERGLLFEAAFVDSLRARQLRLVDLRNTEDPAATAAAMRDGADAIVQAPLRSTTVRGRADVLLRCERTSALGSHSYEAVDTKLARETKAGTLLQLLTYGDLLEPLQGLLPERFHVQTPLGRETYRTADFAAYYRLARRSLDRAVTVTPPPSTYPEPVPHCDVCNYWKVCDGRRRTDDHPSLVANLSRAHTRELQRQKVSTLAQLADCDGELAEEPKRGSRETFRNLGRQAALQRIARETKVIPFEFLPSLPERGLGRLPAPSAGDVFLDFEGDPFIGDGGREYLTGWTTIDGDYTGLWGFTASDEQRAIEAFLDAVAARLKTHPDLHVYHFATYEPAALKRVTQRYGTRVELLDELLRSHCFVDLRAVVREGLRVGVEGYGLKQLEPLVGYARDLSLQDAATARRVLEIALELGTSNEGTDAVKNAVAAYNRDDCRATSVLRDWLEQQRTARINTGETIDRPAAKSGKAQEGITARQARIEAVAGPLREGLDPDRTKWTAEQQPRGLLADLLAYFQREDKCAFWEHYRLRDLPADERLDEREMLAGLQFVGEAPRVGAERNTRHVYRFPPQESAIDDEELYPVEDDDRDVTWATNLGTAVGVDHQRGLLTIKKTKKGLGLHPTAVFRNQYIATDILEKSLLAFGEHVRDHSFDDRSAWGPASDLLLRRQPRCHSHQGGALQHPGEDAVKALTRLCLDLDHSVLPLQGPPGTGKSHSGARAILALIAAGKTVGITAGSHKVIDNLLAKVHEAAQETGHQVRLLHREDGDGPTGITYIDRQAAAAEPGDNTVLGGTAWLWANDKREKKVDYLFVDEAGQMSLATVLAASRGAENLVLLGDPMQLEQPRRGAHPEGTDVAALVHLLAKGQQTLREEQGLFLGVTWRMHRVLTVFTSEAYYEGRLAAKDTCSRQRLDGTDGLDGAGLWLCEVPHEGNQAKADEEVAAVVALCERLLRKGATWTDRDGAVKGLTGDDVLVVAPYNAQVAALARALAAVGVSRVGTVDRFQGQEAAVVVYSCTSSSAEDAPRGMGFLYDPHRFNVATSRAKACVVVVASPRLLEPECRTVEQMRMANGLCAFGELAQRVVMRTSN